MEPNSEKPRRRLPDDALAHSKVYSAPADFETPFLFLILPPFSSSKALIKVWQFQRERNVSDSSYQMSKGSDSKATKWNSSKLLENKSDWNLCVV